MLVTGALTSRLRHILKPFSMMDEMCRTAGERKRSLNKGVVVLAKTDSRYWICCWKRSDTALSVFLQPLCRWHYGKFIESDLLDVSSHRWTFLVSFVFACVEHLLIFRTGQSLNVLLTYVGIVLIVAFRFI